MYAWKGSSKFGSHWYRGRVCIDCGRVSNPSPTSKGKDLLLGCHVVGSKGKVRRTECVPGMGTWKGGKWETNGLKPGCPPMGLENASGCRMGEQVRYA